MFWDNKSPNSNSMEPAPSSTSLEDSCVVTTKNNDKVTLVKCVQTNTPRDRKDIETSSKVIKFS